MANVSIDSGSDPRGLAPGVYIQERGPTPGAGMATGVPLFIGFVQSQTGRVADEEAPLHRPADRPGAPTGRAGHRRGRTLSQARRQRPPAGTEEDDGDGPKAVRLASWDQFAHTVGHPRSDSFLGYAVRGFFENGGRRCVVLPLSVHEETGTAAEALSHALRSVFQPEMYRFDDKGLRGVLDDIDDVDLVCVPDIMIKEIWQSAHGRRTVLELQQHVLEYCRDMGERFAILDVWPGDAAHVAGGVEGAREHWRELASPDGALYGPWVLVTSLDGSGKVWVPPCGHVAGIYARTDAQVGFHKAPANEIVDGVVDVQFEITHEDQGRLNDVGVNCLVSFPRRGIRLWGARTLSPHRNWRYVNVRRIFLTLVRWIEHNMDDVVFEQNDPAIWNVTRERLTGFCYELFQRGALKGITPEEAFFVKCDAELNRREEREEGKVLCEVGLAPLSPAEFILIQITRSAAGTTIEAAGGA